MSTAALIDDTLLLRLVRGDLEPSLASTPLCSTTGYWFRLARAVAPPAGRGRFSQVVKPLDAADRALLRSQIERIDGLVRIADPRRLVIAMAHVASAHRLNLLAAEVIAAALVFDARIVVSRGNTGPRLRAAAAALELDLREGGG